MGSRIECHIVEDGACFDIARNIVKLLLTAAGELRPEQDGKVENLMDEIAAALRKTRLAEAAGVCPGCFAHHALYEDFTRGHGTRCDASAANDGPPDVIGDAHSHSDKS